MPGRVVVQWDKDDCADLGLIKVDLLGLGMMAVREETTALQRADTIGMFQVESRAQQAILPRMKPERFYDLVVQVGIVRPGPIVGKMVHPYLKRRQGREPAECLHPSLERVLRRTLGVPLFQEQLLRMAMIASNFSGGEAEELRRAFSHKRSEAKMREIEIRLGAGMDSNGITGAVQDTIVQAIASFALYGFPESHAASFALLAYASAYLKTHYLAAFTAAMLNNQPMGFYHPSTLIKDAQRHGLKVKPVDVTVSDWPCTLEMPALRLGLRYVRGLREEAGRAIVRRRPFASIDELVRRVPELRKDELTKLAAVGALNALEAAGRRGAMWEAARAIQPVGPLLDAAPAPARAPLRFMTSEERLRADYLGTGVTIGRHPMAWRREEMDARKATPAARLHAMRNGRPVCVAGAVIVRQRPATAHGFVFLSLEDETGIANVIVTPDVFERYRLTLVGAPFLFIEGALQNVDGVVSVKAARIEALQAWAPERVSHDFR
jgi:error-prone DNA polymerase